jgi:uncharacterized membrane protein
MKPNYDRSKHAESLILISVLANVVSLVLNNARVIFFSDNKDWYNQALTVSGYFAVGQVLLLIVSATFFIMWFRRAYWNLHHIGVGGLRYTETMARTSWFIPFSNLIVPLRIMQDIWIETQRAIFRQDNYVKNPKLALWWFAWIAQTILSRFSSNMIRKAETIDDFNEANYFETVDAALSILAGVMLISILRDLRKYETALYESRENVSGSVLFGVSEAN